MTTLERFALADLVHRYAAEVDDRRLDAAAALFAEHAVLVVPDPPANLEPVVEHAGRGAIRAAIGAVESVARTQHEIVGEVFELGDDHRTARGRIACVAHHWTSAGSDITDVVWHLRYDDTYRRTDDSWVFLRRALTINAIETRPVRRLRHPRSG
jgi:hypothetical protein